MIYTMNSSQALSLVGPAQTMLYTTKTGHVRRMVAFSGLGAFATILELSDTLTVAQFLAQFSTSSIEIDDIRE